MKEAFSAYLSNVKCTVTFCYVISFILGHHKSKIYCTPVYATNGQKRSIVTGVRGIREDSLKNVFDNSKLPPNFITEFEGGQIKKLLK